MIDESIFKAYDIRGTYPDQLDEDLARDIGRAFVNHLGLPGTRVVVARDMRLSGEDLQAAFIEGVTQAGADVLSLGMVSTDALYFAVGHLEEPRGAMTAASHNPKNYNGFKLCREEAIALSGESGIGQIRDLITSGKLPAPAEDPRPGPAAGGAGPSSPPASAPNRPSTPARSRRWTSPRTTPSTAWALSRRRA